MTDYDQDLHIQILQFKLNFEQFNEYILKNFDVQKGTEINRNGTSLVYVKKLYEFC